MTLPLPDTTELRKERQSDASWSLRRQRAQGTPKSDERPAGEGLGNATSSCTSISVQTMLGQDDILHLQH